MSHSFCHPKRCGSLRLTSLRIERFRRLWAVVVVIGLLPTLACASAPDYRKMAPSREEYETAAAGEFADTNDMLMVQANAPSPSEPGGNYSRQSAVSGGAVNNRAVDVDGRAGKKLEETRPDSSATPRDAGESSKDVETSSPSPTRLIIYTANFSLLVTDPQNAIDLFVAEVEAAGGYLSQRSNTLVTVRVPAAQFDAILARLPYLGTVTSKNISSQDVTAQFHDIQLRLDTALKSRARLTTLLERADKMEDILRIEREVRRLTQEIESMKGRLRLLSDQISLSTITVSFQKNAPQVVPLSKRRRSRFSWINSVGLERVLTDF